MHNAARATWRWENMSADRKRARDTTDDALPRVALIGDAFMDINLAGLVRLPQWGIDVPCAGVQLTVGGSCANTARQLASIGRDNFQASFFSGVGDDSMGNSFRRALREEGLLVDVDTSLHVLKAVPQSCCTILAGPSDRAMISCYSSNHGFSLLPFREVLLGATWAGLHLGGYFNCVGLHTQDLLDVVGTMRGSGTLITLDPQHDAEEKWTGEGDHLTKLFPSVDVFLPNEVEACRVAETLLGGGVSYGEPMAAMEALAKAYPRLLIIVTLGASGLVAARGPTERWSQPALPADFVDATGAGDACAAAILAALLRDRTDVPGALKAGAAAGALCVAVAGACDTPITAEAHAVKLQEASGSS